MITQYVIDPAEGIDELFPHQDESSTGFVLTDGGVLWIELEPTEE